MMLKGQWPGQIRVAPNSGPGDMSGPIESVIEIGTWPTGIQLKPKSSLEKSHVNGKELLPASRLHFLHEPGMKFWRPGQGKSRSGMRAVAWVLTRCCMPRSPSCSLPGHHPLSPMPPPSWPPCSTPLLFTLIQAQSFTLSLEWFQGNRSWSGGRNRPEAIAQVSLPRI